MIYHNATNIAPNGPTVAEFGSGDIIVNTITPGNGESYPFGITMINAPEPTPPGTDCPNYDGVSVEALGPQVVLTFTKSESFDTVISRLQLAKEAFLAAAK